ncbi:MAG TPA: hypothetical protein VGC13_10550 [Longimicrobium sp.]|uniref:hypothetical protein n=1 Tax=Longimicrobium sp. TaxID=2029185 RepID=UPI002ED88656
MSRHIIERCPSCGVEHDVRVDGCEACGTALRYWCRAHSREIGWLESAECRRCAEDEARRRPRTSVPVAASPRTAAPSPVPPRPTASPHEAAPPPAPPPRPPSSVTPYWCGTHSPEIGFLASPVCPRCAEEAARILRAAVPAAAPPPPAAAPPPRGRRTMAAPPPPAAPVPAPAPADTRGPVDAREPGRPGVLLRVFDALLSMLWVVIVCILIGVAAGGMQAAISQGDIPLMAVHWGVYGGMLGVLLGFFYAVGHFNFSGRR